MTKDLVGPGQNWWVKRPLLHTVMIPLLLTFIVGAIIYPNLIEHLNSRLITNLELTWRFEIKVLFLNFKVHFLLIKVLTCSWAIFRASYMEMLHFSCFLHAAEPFFVLLIWKCFIFRASCMQLIHFSSFESCMHLSIFRVSYMEIPHWYKCVL